MLSTRISAIQEVVSEPASATISSSIDSAVVLAQLKQQLEEKDAQLTRRDQALAAAEAIIHQLKQALRLERIRKYGQRSEKLSDLQLELLDLEPAVSSDDVETEIAGGPLSEEQPEEQNASSAAALNTDRLPGHWRFRHMGV